MFSVQDLLAGIFSTQTFKPDELPEASEPKDPITLEKSVLVRELIPVKDGNHFVTAGTDGMLRLFDTETRGEVKDVLDGNMHAALKSHITALAPLGDGVFVSGDNKSLVTTWDAETREPRATIELYNNEVTAITALTDDSFIVGTHSGRMGSFGHRQGRALQEVSVIPEAHKAEVTSLVSKVGLLVSSSLDRTVKIWSSETFRPLGTLQHGNPVLCADVDRYVLVTGCAEGEIRVYRNNADYPLDKMLRGLHGSSPVRSAMLLGNNVLMSAGGDTVVFTDIFYQRPLARVQMDVGIRGATILRDGRVAVCGTDGASAVVFPAPIELKTVIDEYVKTHFNITVEEDVDAALDAEVESEEKTEVAEEKADQPVEKMEVKKSNSSLKRAARKKMSAAVKLISASKSTKSLSSSKSTKSLSASKSTKSLSA